jgi:phage terminase small subunit
MLGIMNKLTKNPPHLSQKRRLFADAYLQGVPTAKAYADAGYATKSAQNNSSRLMCDEAIKAYIAYYRAETAKRNEITQDEIVKNTREIILRCMQHAKVLDKKGNQVWIETPNGNIVPAYTFQASEALKGNELLAKLGNLFKDPGEDKGNTYIGIMLKGVPKELEGKLKQHLKDKPSHHLKEAKLQETADV